MPSSPVAPSAPGTAPEPAPGASPGLHTELYQLIQAAVYHADGLWGEAVFDLYLKDLPDPLAFAIAAGIGPAVDAVLEMRFSGAEISWLAQQPGFAGVPAPFFESLRHFRFEGDIYALPEGTAVHPNEPLLRVVAPLTQVGLVETRLVQTITHATGVATRGARMVAAAQGRALVDFGSRRCPDAEAAWHAARSGWIAGCAATTNAGAAASLQIPAWGVISESLLAAYDEPARAWAALRQYFPGGCHVNLPEDSPVAGVGSLAPLQRDLRTVRLDHRDLVGASREVRVALDAAGFSQTRILGSGSLDEAAIGHIAEEGAPIAILGVGASLSLGRPETTPRLSYRMAEMTRGLELVPANGRWSAPWPGRKQVIRFRDHDILCLDVETPGFEAQGGSPLLEPWVLQGERIRPPEDLASLRTRCAAELRRLPPGGAAERDWRVLASDALMELSLR